MMSRWQLVLRSFRTACWLDQVVHHEKKRATTSLLRPFDYTKASSNLIDELSQHPRSKVCLILVFRHSLIKILPLW